MENLKLLIQKWGGSYSGELGIDLKGCSPREVLKWFIASLLFGARISEIIAKRTYRAFERNGLLSPEKILEAGCDRLVEVLDEGGYVRYDFKTADKFLSVMGRLMDKYRGNLNNVHEKAADPRDLEARIKELGKGIGDVTVNIFLREMRDIWEKAQPLPQGYVIVAARELGYARILGNSNSDREEIMKDLWRVWSENKIEGKAFVDFEAALLRAGRKIRRREKLFHV